MREPQFDRLRSDVADAVRQPEFSTVRQRAGGIRRRRIATSSAVFVVTALAAASFGYTVQNAPPDYGSLDPVPEVTCSTDCGWPWMTASASTGSELYGLVRRCEDCASELYASSDGGGSWQQRTVPPAPAGASNSREASLAAQGPGLLTWREQRTFVPDVVQTHSTGGPTADPTAQVSILQTWVSRNGGGTWVRAAAGTGPAAAVPQGARPADCDLVEMPACKVGVLDPDTGRFAPLAAQPTGITVDPGWTSQVSAPIDGRLWVPGLDPATRKPAVATSSDAGRTWRTHVFTDGEAAPAGKEWLVTSHVPKIAVGTGTTAYALTYRDDGAFDTHYSTDGGTTWRSGDTVERIGFLPGYVAADGSHIIPTDTGATAGRDGEYAPVTLSGIPEAAMRTVQITTGQADQPYLMPSSGSDAYLSKDGRTWQQVRLP
ncbi:sialidase family protein [Actinoplanes sp. CA-252034]|uniref:sialidase family protein n=1 Tax=Actinoplanes sp. CA-252034 TaxID=3239906 RepID=UPI003D98BB00